MFLSKIDWGPIARQVTARARSTRGRHYAIYRWLCDNIAYDVDYRIYHADECYRLRKGVCQAYVEIYILMASALGLKTKYLCGKVKDYDGKINASSHAWLIAYDDDGRGMLIDPTWGAGSVNEGKFVRNLKDDTWFDASPFWMVFSHFPSDAADQLLKSPISAEQFAAIPGYQPMYYLFGIRGSELLRRCLLGTAPKLPMCYYRSFDEVGVNRVWIPADSRLTVGRVIDICIETDKRADQVMFISTGCGPSYNHGSWVKQGAYVYGKFLPAREGEVKLVVDDGKGSLWTIASYSVAPPTPANIADMIKLRPDFAPVMDQVRNFNYSAYKQAEVDMHEVLREVQRGSRFLPTIYSKYKIKVHDIPLNGFLKPNQRYSFEFTPPPGHKCAVILECDHGTDWLYHWRQGSRPGSLRIDVTPKHPGKLLVSLCDGLSNPYYACMEWVVG